MCYTKRACTKSSDARVGWDVHGLQFFRDGSVMRLVFVFGGRINVQFLERGNYSWSKIGTDLDSSECHRLYGFWGGAVKSSGTPFNLLSIKKAQGIWTLHKSEGCWMYCHVSTDCPLRKDIPRKLPPASNYCFLLFEAHFGT